MFLKLVRSFKTGWKNLIRNGWLAIATISIIVVALFIVNIQLAMIFANNLLLEDVEDRVNISVYIDSKLNENQILKIKKEISEYPEVEKIVYITKEEALADFKERTKDNEVIQKAFNEIGENPLGAVLNVKAHNPDQYQEISRKIAESSFREKVSSVNYQKYRIVIDKLNQEIKANRREALIIGITLSIIAILITFNSIRITMYSHRQEIEIMRLIGASKNYIRMPFVWEGIFYGIIAAILAIPLSFLYLKFISSGGGGGSILSFSNTRFIGNFLGNYFMDNIIWIILFQGVVGVFLGVISSLIAIRRYLKV